MGFEVEGDTEDGGDAFHAQRSGIRIADVGGQAETEDPDAHAANHLISAQRDGEKGM